jgi:hypothetical protein
MKKALITLLAVIGLAAAASTSFAQGYHYVRSHVRSNGSYVPGHYQTNPDGNFHNNWSTRGNVNPFTGDFGTRREPTSRFFHFEGSSRRAW